MKYIVTVTETDKEELFVFNESINHDCMAEVLNRIKNTTHGNWVRVRRKPIAAGFINSVGMCYGRSETLNLDSRGDVDTLLFKLGCEQ